MIRQGANKNIRLQINIQFNDLKVLTQIYNCMIKIFTLYKFHSFPEPSVQQGHLLVVAFVVVIYCGVI